MTAAAGSSPPPLTAPAAMPDWPDAPRMDTADGQRAALLRLIELYGLTFPRNETASVTVSVLVVAAHVGQAALATLQDLDPAAADRLAVALWGEQEDGGVILEMAWDAARTLGVPEVPDVAREGLRRRLDGETDQ